MNNFFKSDEERNLWIRLNAERIMYGQKMLNCVVGEGMGDIKTQYTPMGISYNQLVYDEKFSTALRYSLEELLLPEDELFILSQNRNVRIISEIFEHYNKKGIEPLHEEF